MQIAKDFPQEPDILLLLLFRLFLAQMMSNSIFMDVLHIFVRSQLARQVILWLTPLTLQFWPVPSGTVPACGVSLKKSLWRWSPVRLAKEPQPAGNPTKNTGLLSRISSLVLFQGRLLATRTQCIAFGISLSLQLLSNTYGGISIDTKYSI